MLLTRNIIGAEIVRQAERFVGLYERVNNAVWDDPTTPGEDARAGELVRLMEGVGWQKGWPYCAALVEAMWAQAYRKLGADPAVIARFGKILCPHVMTSWRAVQAAELDYTGWNPAPGSIGFYRHAGTTNGHAVIVSSVEEDSGSTLVRFSTVEGNTMPEAADAAKDREGGGQGDGVFRKIRRMNYGTISGLVLQGFLQPIECEGQPLAIRPDKTEGLS